VNLSGPGVQWWLHRLDRSPAEAELATLSRTEIDRARRFAFERDRRRYLAAHCALRARLAASTGLPAQALQFVEGPHGKPRLQDAPGCAFNLAHSEDLALIGIGTDGTEIGVDVEVLRTIDDAEPLAQRLFTPGEYLSWTALPQPARRAGFLRLWTRKEACLKAVGAGLSIAPASVAAGLQPDQAMVELCWAGGQARIELRSIDVGPDAVAAVACVVEGRRG
jgi:4'-phosphopantetheinyl transferase